MKPKVFFYLSGPGWQWTLPPGGGLPSLLRWAKSYKKQGAKHVYIAKRAMKGRGLPKVVERPSGNRRGE